MNFIALKTEDGRKKGKITFFCKVLDVSRQGFYQYLMNRNRPWKYRKVAELIQEICHEDLCNDTYERIRMYQALQLKNPDSIPIPSESTVYRMKTELFYDRYDSEQMTVEQLKSLVWRYFMSYWNNRRICSANGGLPPAVKRQRFYENQRTTA